VVDGLDLHKAAAIIPRHIIRPCLIDLEGVLIRRLKLEALHPTALVSEQHLICAHGSR
jgi:hypothetical protein